MCKVITAFACLFLVVPCAPGNTRGGDRGADYPNLPSVEELSGTTSVEYVPNEMIVKFRRTVAYNLEKQLELKRSASELTLSRDLDELNAKHRVKEIKPVFKNFKKQRQRIKALLKKDKALLTQKEKHILRRLKRAPKGAKVPDLDRIYKIQVEVDVGQSLEEVAAAYNKNPDVEYAELNYIVSICKTPNDPLYPIQWPLNNTGQMYPESGRYTNPPGTPDCDIDAPEAWDTDTGSSEVIIAVVDTGVDYSHRDLQSNMWVNNDEIPGNGLDDDGNGYIDDIYGYDFINNDSDPIDDHGHGTHCSGTIAAEGDNGLDVTGVCWSGKIMALKFLGWDGYGGIDDAVTAFYYAVDNAADVVSNSWGGGGHSETAEQAIDYAYSQGVIMVAAAGNDNTDSPHYPAYYEHMIAVAATDSDDRKASFSNYGDWVDIAAPGVDILSLRAEGTSGATPYDAYTTIASGTSMACPHVAGACAVLLSIDPVISVDQTRDILQDATDPIASGICQSGRLNLYEASFRIIKPKGTVRLDQDAYSCSGLVAIEVRDSDLKGDGSQDVTVTSDGGDMETLLLTEASYALGLFTGTITTDSGDPIIEDATLQVAHGEIITATYYDTDDGTGNPATAEDSAAVDCQPPSIFNVQIDVPGPVPTVSFETDEPTVGGVLCGLACSGPYTIDGNDWRFTETHAIKITGVSPETDYFFVVEAADVVGNQAVEDNNGLCYPFTTDAPHDIYVPSQYSTIQGAIDHSWDGGTVSVADGTYTGSGNRDIDFKGRAITVRSDNGPQACIIDCQGKVTDQHRGFLFRNHERADSVLEGFTIQNGYAYYGGGIYCDDASPTIINCIFLDNLAKKGYSGRGGGLYCRESNLRLIDCIFSGNVADEKGGAVKCEDGGSPVLTNCEFYGNVVYGFGGGVHCSGDTDPTLTNCIFTGNWAKGTIARGGGLYCILNEPVVTNCIFTGNLADHGGGGMLSGYECNSTVVNCTFSGNTAGRDGGGMLNYLNSNTAVTNCILWGNSDSGGTDQSAQIYDNDVYVIKYCCVQGWKGGGEGNIDVDPCFVDTGYWDGDTWVDGDYHLQPYSLCINAGDPCGDYAGRTDIDGEPRVFYGRVDIGADEAIDPSIAGNPHPHNGVADVLPNTVLSWTPGDFAVSHDVYFGTSSADVTDANTSYDPKNVYKGPQSLDANTYDPPGELGFGKTYYWRVDEVNDPNLWKGQLWSFTVADAKAKNPGPGNQRKNIHPDAVLTWSSGGYWVESYKIYFSEDWNNVNDRTLAGYKGTQGVDANSYDPGGLVLGTTYYWRIDEFNDSNMWEGHIWCFTVDDGKSRNPSPTGDCVPPDANLSWTPGIVATAHDLYFGTDWDDVSDANGTFLATVVDANSYDPGPLKLGVKYFWRVDAIGTATHVEGDVWSFTVDEGKASNPNPSEEVTNLPPYVCFSWSPGAYAAWHDVYLGSDFDDVNNANSTNHSNVDYDSVDANSYNPGGVELDKTYYWRIDAVSATTYSKGDVWKFTVTDGKANNPNPADGAVDVPPDVVLSWSPGDYETSHDVYFGTDFEDVNNANSTSHPYVDYNNLDVDSYDPGGLVLGETYYWRIDELIPGTRSKGEVWSFTTIEYIIVDDFEVYDESSLTDDPCLVYIPSEQEDGIWRDVWSYTTWPRPLAYLDPNYSILRGTQSLEFKYNNNFGGPGMCKGYSEAWRPYEADLLNTGVKALSVWFHGSAANDEEKMYVALEDTEGHIGAVFYPNEPNDPNLKNPSYYQGKKDVKKEDWHEWHIKLEEFTAPYQPEANDVNLASVSKFYLGFGDRENPVLQGSGLFSGVYFDDIRLYIRRCVAEYGPKADLSADCIVDLEDFAILANQWHQSPGSPSADIAPEPLDSFVDLLDLAILVDCWLDEKWFPEEP